MGGCSMDRCVNESYNGLRVNPKWIDTWTDDGCVGDGGEGVDSWLHSNAHNKSQR